MEATYQKLDKDALEHTYNTIRQFHQKFLEKAGVRLPNLIGGDGTYTKDALVLVYLALGYPNTRAISKEELTLFVRSFFPNTNDVQQARHLGAQDGWWIVAGGRDNIVVHLKRGWYQLHTLEKPYPAFTQGHRVAETGDWEVIKQQYHFRCATCGSEEGEPHLHWSATKTKLQKAHMNPLQPLVSGNIIPQCQKCNRADRNWWVYDAKGRVVGIADPSVVRRCSPEIQKKMYHLLHTLLNVKDTG